MLKIDLLNRLRTHFDVATPGDDASWSDWDEWEENKSKNNPKAYFLLHTLVDRLETKRYNFCRPFRTLSNYIAKRFIYKVHILKTGLPIDWHGLDDRILYSAFNALVDYVEIIEDTVAHYNVGSFNNYKVHWWYKLPLIVRFKPLRSQKIGLNLTLMSVMENFSPHNEIWNLYVWWSFIRPARINAEVLSGLKEFRDSTTAEQVWTPENMAKQIELIDKMHDIDMLYIKEDEEMLIRLIKISRSI